MLLLAMDQYAVYMLRCSDRSYYTGVTNDVERRLLEHTMGGEPTCYTYTRRPVALVYYQWFDSPHKAIRWEKQIQGWSRKKKEALIGGDWESIRKFAMNRKNREKHAQDGASTRASAHKD